MMTLPPLNPDLFYPIMGWPWGQEDPTIHHYVDPIINNNSNNNLLPYYAQTSESIIFADHSLPMTSDPQQLNLQENKLNSSEGNVTGLETPTSLKAKKLNHNASERDRRKRINDLYSSLRSLLPAADHKKKLSIPATVSRVVKYIPELQKEVNKLIREKEEIKSRICSKETKSSAKIHHGADHDQKKIDSISSHDPLNIDISAREIGDREITIQICVADDDSEKWRFPEVLQTLEDVGFLLLGVSSFTSGHRLFRNMHLKQVQGSQRIECAALEREVLYLYKKRNSF